MDAHARVEALAVNAVAPAVNRYNADHPDLTEPWFLPLSLREAIALAVVAKLRAEGYAP